MAGETYHPADPRINDVLVLAFGKISLEHFRRDIADFAFSEPPFSSPR